ncbi:competence protein [Lentibacillus cibarius]|uniref:Competence protein n=1 Tax=Lentibacillus cibarius TaxID=2583219 RepID=A0A549YFS3_9BACI|nr:competence protein ComK [Lentibacillus cibarius]TMN21968.1 competence protein [Lentibacillus cibarius]TRM10734.1 competence protein [Lentibacillus cibarius]
MVYIISQQTKAILAKDASYYRSLILEVSRRRHSVYHPERIIDNTCVLNGATLEGRRGSVKRLLNVCSKVPVPVIQEQGVYMLPTASSKKKDNVWLSFYHIDYYEQRDDRTYVSFHDGTGLYVNTSRQTFDMQYKRTGELIAKLSRPFFFGGNTFPWNHL